MTMPRGVTGRSTCARSAAIAASLSRFGLKVLSETGTAVIRTDCRAIPASTRSCRASSRRWTGPVSSSTRQRTSCGIQRSGRDAMSPSAERRRRASSRPRRTALRAAEPLVSPGERYGERDGDEARDGEGEHDDREAVEAGPSRGAVACEVHAPGVPLVGAEASALDGFLAPRATALTEPLRNATTVNEPSRIRVRRRESVKSRST